MMKKQDMMPPQEVLKGLEKVMEDIKAEELTPEGRAALFFYSQSAALQCASYNSLAIIP